MCHPQLHHFTKKTMTWSQSSSDFHWVPNSKGPNERQRFTNINKHQPNRSKMEVHMFLKKRPFFKRFNGILGISPVYTVCWLYGWLPKFNEHLQKFFDKIFLHGSTFQQWFFVGTSNFMGLSTLASLRLFPCTSPCLPDDDRRVFSMVEPDMGPKACPNQSYKWICLTPRKNPFVFSHF